MLCYMILPAWCSRKHLAAVALAVQVMLHASCAPWEPSRQTPHSSLCCPCRSHGATLPADEYNTEMGRAPLPSSFRQAKRDESRAAAMARGQGQGYPIGLAAHAEEAAPAPGQRQQEGRRGPIEWALRKCRGGDGPENPPANKFRVRARCMWPELAQRGRWNGWAETRGPNSCISGWSQGLAKPHVVDRLMEVAGQYAVGEDCGCMQAAACTLSEAVDPQQEGVWRAGVDSPQACLLVQPYLRQIWHALPANHIFLGLVSHVLHLTAFPLLLSNGRQTV